VEGSSPKPGRRNLDRAFAEPGVHFETTPGGNMTNVESQSQDYSAWIGHAVVDQSGNKVGRVSQIFVDDQGQPLWLTVNTGMFKSRSSFVPLDGATADGDRLVVAYDKAQISDAPQVDDDGDGYISPEEEEALYRYYGRAYTTGSTEGYATGTTQGYATGQTESEIDTTQRAGYDTSGPSTDDAMTRSEEQVRVGTARQEVGRARLRKYVVTENVTTTVPVSHEEVRIEREPITDANRDAAMSGPEISEEEHEVVLTEERPVVQKEVVPVERVRLAKETVTEEATVNEQVRKERIDTEGADVAGEVPER
jgi:uncharacterized protein (TIGR02271 family)